MPRRDVLALSAAIAEFGERSTAVGQQALLVGRIDPGACNHPRAVVRAYFVLVGVDQSIDSRPVHQPLFDEQRFERFDSKRHV